MTLTIKLDLDKVQVDLHVKLLVCTSNGSVMKAWTDTHTDAHTNGTGSITSTADGGVQKLSCLFAKTGLLTLPFADYSHLTVTTINLLIVL